MAAAVLPRGDILLGVLLVIGFASLAQFPLYYSFSQELTERHQGKLTGSLSCINWLAMYLMQELAGASAVQTGSYSQGMALAGLAPLAGFAAMIVLWGKDPPPPEDSPPEAENAPSGTAGSTAIQAAKSDTTTGIQEEPRDA